MSNRDKTGPNGRGPRTGRGLGDCEITNQDSNQETRPRRGLRRRFRNN